MKRFLSILASLLACAALHANVADPNPGTLVQPDGSTINVILRGDEFHHTLTAADGTPLRRGEDGFYRPGSRVVPTGMNDPELKRRQRNRDLAGRAPSDPGNYHFLVILVEFSDMRFTVQNPKEAFSAMLNEEGYRSNGANGSAADFFRDNSAGAFHPVYDVVGPVTLTRSYKYYGGNNSDGNDKHADQALYEACQAMDPYVDFSRYDSDGDGYVDGVFFYYAGHNEAEYGGDDTIWPHAWALYNYRNAIFDGVRVFSYACTSEYRGSAGSNMCGIGTFCHEFGHVLGLPDLYDTDNEENGSVEAMYEFSLMSMGSYNNSGRTPSNLTALERILLGWMDEPTETDESGAYRIGPLSDGEAILLPTSNEGELFMCELRDGKGWDAYVPMGMIIYHVDMSENRVGKTTARELWESGYGINCDKSHPCMYLAKARNSNMSKYYPYPGAADVRTFSHDTWNGHPLPFTMDGINFDGDKVSFNLTADPARIITGNVTDQSGRALEGATVTATAPASAASTKSGSDGNYTLDVTDMGGGTLDVTVRLAGFSPIKDTTPARRGTTVMNFRMERKTGDGSLEGMGFTYIEEYGKLVVGDGKTVDSVTWGTSGNTVTASVVYTDGSREQLRMDLR